MTDKKYKQLNKTRKMPCAMCGEDIIYKGFKWARCPYCDSVSLYDFDNKTSLLVNDFYNARG